MTTTTTQLYRHPKLDLSAPAPYWTALGFTVYSNTDVVRLSMSDKDVDESILIGLEETGANDHRALVWALKEVQRRKEAKTQSTAIARLAEALHTIRVPADLDVAPLERAVDRLTTTLTQNAPKFARRSSYNADA